MPSKVQRHILFDVGADLGWPEVPGLVGAGEAVWRAVLGGSPPLTPLERARVLAAVAPAMLQITEGGRARLETWTAHPTPALERLQIRNALAFFGDAPCSTWWPRPSWTFRSPFRRWRCMRCFRCHGLVDGGISDRCGAARARRRAAAKPGRARWRRARCRAARVPRPARVRP